MAMWARLCAMRLITELLFPYTLGFWEHIGSEFHNANVWLALVAAGITQIRMALPIIVTLVAKLVCLST